MKFYSITPIYWVPGTNQGQLIPNVAFLLLHITCVGVTDLLIVKLINQCHCKPILRYECIT